MLNININRDNKFIYINSDYKIHLGTKLDNFYKYINIKEISTELDNNPHYYKIVCITEKDAKVLENRLQDLITLYNNIYKIFKLFICSVNITTSSFKLKLKSLDADYTLNIYPETNSANIKHSDSDGTIGFYQTKIHDIDTIKEYIIKNIGT